MSARIILQEFVGQKKAPTRFLLADLLYSFVLPADTWPWRDAVDFDFPPIVTFAPGERALSVSFDPTNAATLAMTSPAQGHHGRVVTRSERNSTGTASPPVISATRMPRSQGGK